MRCITRISSRLAANPAWPNNKQSQVTRYNSTHKRRIIQRMLLQQNFKMKMPLISWENNMSTALWLIITGTNILTLLHTHTTRHTHTHKPSFTEALSWIRVPNSYCITSLQAITSGCLVVPTQLNYNCMIIRHDQWRPNETHLFMTHRMPGFNYRDHHLRHLENFPDLLQLAENCCLGLHLGICNRNTI